jgi:Flp pilus assembly protein TadB
MPATQHMRVSDADRQQVADRLAEHYGEGRLDKAEFDERLGRAMNAKTRADLSGLLDDLPQNGAPAAADPVPSRRRPQRGRHHGLIVVALVVILALALAHVVVWMTVPWLWLAFIAVVALAVTRRRSHIS